jgi:hypothetical protein
MRRYFAATISMATILLASACSLDSLSRDYGVKSSPAEAGSDAAIAADATSGACQATFCDDFETGTLLERWTRVEAATGGDARALSAAAHAGAAGLLVAIPDVAKAPSPIAVVVKEFTETANEVSLAFDFFADDLRQKTRAVPAATLQFPTGGGATREARLILGERIYFKEIGFDASETTTFGHDHTLTATLTPGRWTRVEMTIGLVAPGHVTLRFDDTVALDAAMIGTWSPGAVTALLGVLFTELPASAYQLRYDDVAITVR